MYIAGLSHSQLPVLFSLTVSSFSIFSYKEYKQSDFIGVHWKDWCWSWNSNTLATWCEELTHLKRPWCWERLKAGGEGDDRGWDAWMASPTQLTWVWVNSRSWWWTGRPDVLRFMGSQRVGHDWVTELNWIFLTVHHIVSAHKINLEAISIATILTKYIFLTK